MRARLGRAVLAALALTAALPGSAAAGGEAAAPRRVRYLPHHAKLQLAGNVGFVSPGLGYAAFGRRLEGDLFLDVMLKTWAESPRTIGPADVFSLAVGLRARI